MEVFLGLLVWGVIIGLIVYAVKKNKKEEEEQEERLRLALIEEEKRKQQELATLKIKWENKKKEFLTNGLPSLTPDTLRLEKDEICHFADEAYFCKQSQQTVGYKGHRDGYSFRIVKGITHHIGNSQGHYIKETIINKTHGSIYLTNKKIVFSAITNSCVIKHKDIINLNAFDGMLQILTNSKAYLFQIEDNFNFMLMLEYIINKEDENILQLKEF